MQQVSNMTVYPTQHRLLKPPFEDDWYASIWPPADPLVENISNLQCTADNAQGKEVDYFDL